MIKGRESQTFSLTFQSRNRINTITIYQNFHTAPRGPDGEKSPSERADDDEQTKGRRHPSSIYPLILQADDSREYPG